MVACVILLDRTTSCLGYNDYGQIGNNAGGRYQSWPPSAIAALGTNAVQIVFGQYHALALLNDGSVMAWGTDNTGSYTGLLGLGDLAF